MFAQVKAFIAANRIAFYVGLALLFMVILLLAYCQGRSDERSRADAARAVANVEALQLDAEAQANASAARVNDAQELLELKRELTDAVADIPDTVPDDVAVAAGCGILRRQGTDTSAIPACGGR